MMKKTKKRKSTVTGYVLSAVTFLAVLTWFTMTTVHFAGQADERGTDTLRNAIARSAVQCYAIEGRYPPSVQYLVDNYGIQIDKSKYDVFYSGFASNVLPDITVVPKSTRKK